MTALGRPFRSRRGFAAVLAACLTGGVALSDITDINSVRLQLRRFNDYPNSQLNVTSNFPSLIRFQESNFGMGGFANQHVARFSSDNGMTDRRLLNSEAFDITVSMALDVGSVRPRKEMGFRLDSFIAGESFFIITSDGEVAAFGGPFPFHTFGNNAYTPGTAAEMRLIYRPGAPSTMEYIFNGVSSGQLAFGNLENGIINGTDIGLYAQNQPDDNNPGDFSDAVFRNIRIAVPEPATLSLLSLAGLALLRRRG